MKAIFQFNNTWEAVIDVHDTVDGRAWYEMAKKFQPDEYQLQDPMRYTFSYFENLLRRLKSQIGWDWTGYEFTQENFNIMHKFLEENEKVFAKHNLEFLDDVHTCLHTLEETQGQLMENRNSVHIKAFNAHNFEIQDRGCFTQEPCRGDVSAGFPYIGKTPLICAKHNDTEKLNQTCRLHDRANGGFMIHLLPRDRYYTRQRSVLESWLTGTGKGLLDIYSEQDIWSTYGVPVIGRINDSDILSALDQEPLDLTGWRFED